MKKINLKLISLSVIASCMTIGCSVQPPKGYKIEAQLTGVSDSTQVEMFEIGSKGGSPFGSTFVKDGRFVLEGDITEPTAVYLTVNSKEKGPMSQLLILEKGNTISLTNQDARLSWSGSPLTDKYQQIMDCRKPLDSIYTANDKKFKAIKEAHSKAYQAKDTAEMKRLSQTDEFKAMSEADKAFFAEVEKVYYKTVMKNKDNFFGPLSMLSFFSYLTEEQKPWYEEFSDEAKNSKYGKMVKKEVCPDTKVGTKTVDFTETNYQGVKQSLSELTKGKRVVLIDFWASWCNPCRKEIPNLKQIYAKHAANGFEIVSVSIDKKEADWKKAVKEEGLQWPNFRDTQDIASTYAVRFVPTMYIVAADGTILAENLRGEELAKKIDELMK